MNAILDGLEHVVENFWDYAVILSSPRLLNIVYVVCYRRGKIRLRERQKECINKKFAYIYCSLLLPYLSWP